MFAKDTPIRLSDNTCVPIRNIIIGDKLQGDAFVTGITVIDGSYSNWYDYKSVLITGTQVVYEDGQWKQAAGTDKGLPIDPLDRAYTLNISSPRLYISGILFNTEDLIRASRSSGPQPKGNYVFKRL